MNYKGIFAGELLAPSSHQFTWGRCKSGTMNAFPTRFCNTHFTCCSYSCLLVIRFTKLWAGPIPYNILWIQHPIIAKIGITCRGASRDCTSKSAFTSAHRRPHKWGLSPMTKAQGRQPNLTKIYFLVAVIICIHAIFILHNSGPVHHRAYCKYMNPQEWTSCQQWR